VISVPVKDSSGNQLESIEIDPDILGGSLRMRLMREAVLVHRNNTRVGCASTKRRRERAGSNAKLYRQKHTGRARVGSSRGTQRVGGGRPKGPKPHDYTMAFPRKARRLATKSALLGKFQDGEVLVVDKLQFDAPKTAEAVRILHDLGVADRSCLVVLADYDVVVHKSFRNVPRLAVMPVRELNTYDILTHARLLITREAFDAIAGGSGDE